MKRTTSSPAANKKKTARSPEQPDPFRFGWRYVCKNGGSVQVPLTLDDVLHPQEGDQIPENTQQEKDRRYLANVLEWRVADRPVLVLSDCLINWGVPGLGNHSPDISVFEGVQNRNRVWKTFVVAQEGARPLLTIEVVSPDAHAPQARNNDVVTKVAEYHRAKVPLYVIVDQEKENGPRQLVGYRYEADQFVRLPLDEQGRLLLGPLRLWLQLRDERVVCFDADTGEEIPDLAGMAQARAAEAEARRAAEAALAAAQARIRELEARTRPNGQSGPGT